MKTIKDKQKLMYVIIKHLMDNNYIDFKKLNQKLPKDKLETMTQDEILSSFIDVLGLENIERQMGLSKPKVNEWKWI